MTEILVDMPVDEAALARVRAMPGVHVQIVEPAEQARTLAPELLQPINVLFCMFPPRNFCDMRSLRWIQIGSAGYSQLFGLGLSAKGVRATNARGCFDVPIAEWNVAMMINLARNLRGMIRNQEAAVWNRSAEFQQEIRGLTVGIWGYGGIGRETARLARALGMRVHVLDKGPIGPVRSVYFVPGTGDPEGVLPNRVYAPNERAAFLHTLDFLVLAMPLDAETEGIVGERELRALPPTAFVLNPARGPLIRQDALLRALEQGWIAGAALDTHYQYPMPPDHPLWRFPNVIFTPHISGSSLSTHYRARIWEIFSQNLERFLRGESLLNELSAAQLPDE